MASCHFTVPWTWHSACGGKNVLTLFMGYAAGWFVNSQVKTRTKKW